MAVNTFDGETLSDTELLDKIYDSNRMKLSKGVRKYRRGLKEQARKILGLTNEEIQNLFQVKQLDSKIKEKDIKRIQFNDIEFEGKVYEGELNDYQMEVIRKMFDFDWGENIEVEGDRTTSNPTHKYMRLVIDGIGQLYITNTYNGLEYLGKLPKEGTELFLVSKLLKERLEKKINSICNTLEYDYSLVSDIIGNPDMHGKKTTNFSNQEIYDTLNKSSLKENLDDSFQEIVEYIYFIKNITSVLKEKYPDFQEPIEFDENGFNTEEYKKGLVFDAIKKIRKEYN